MTSEGMGAVAPAAFADACKTVLLAAPQPGSVASEMFHGEKAMTRLRQKAILTGTDVVVDTSCSSKNTIFRGRNSQVIFVVLGRQNVPYEKNSQTMRTDQNANIISSMGKTDEI